MPLCICAENGTRGTTRRALRWVNGGHRQGFGRRLCHAAHPAILAEGESYGYAILRRVSELSGGQLRWTDGMLYPVLHRLERLGHVTTRGRTSEVGRRRKYYRITRQGLAQLTSLKRQWQVVDATLRGIWLMVFEETGRRPTPLLEKA